MALLPAVGDILDKIFPDKNAAEAAKVRLVELAQQGELARLNADTQLATAQAETNKIEAASGNLFVSGWRPAVGWICALAVGFKFIGGPMLFMIGQAIGHPVELPRIDTEELWPLLLGMLGLGAFRTVEKVKGAA
ncbi:3TM-type holin [Variovorax sp. RA8]|uniref:3TM-type holin n=1 Tax=Variovorax sp. (strain JCM 16519 / RA8) TaxID=662548 RepID=UPI0018D97E4E|nr:3TM-type holin [Variovorax sp. RA8]